MTDHCIQCTCCILHILHDACMADKFIIIIVRSGASVYKQVILCVFFVFLFVCIITSAYFKDINNCLYNQLHKCDWAYENQPCEPKLHQVIFLLISSAMNVVSHSRQFLKKVH